MRFLDLVAYSQEVHLLVEEDLVLVLVVHPLDVPQHIFLGDDSEQTPVVRDQRLAEAQLLEHVHHRLHGRLVRDGHWRQIHDPVEGKMEIKLSKTAKRKLAKHEKGCKTMERLPGESKRAVAGVGPSCPCSVAVAGEVDDSVGGDRIEAISGGLDRQVEVPAQDEAHQVLRLRADDDGKAVVVRLGEHLLHLAQGHRV